MSNDYRDNMTLDEMGANDGEMSKEAIKNAKRYYFVTQNEAFKFRGACLKDSLTYLGIHLSATVNPKFVDKMLKGNGVQVENREHHYQGPDAWRNGLYIYKRGELVAFISVIVEGKPDGALIWSQQRDNAKFSVITNARVK